MGPLSCGRACFSSSTQPLLRSVSFCFHALRSVQFSFWLSSFATIVNVCAHAYVDSCFFVRAVCACMRGMGPYGRAAVPVCQFSFSPNHDMPHGRRPAPPLIIICPNLPPSLYLAHARARVCVSGDFSLGFSRATAVLF